MYVSPTSSVLDEVIDSDTNLFLPVGRIVSVRARDGIHFFGRKDPGGLGYLYR